MKSINIRIMSYSLRNFCLLSNLMFVKVLLVCIRYPQNYQNMWDRVISKQTALENSFNLTPSPYFIISSTISWELLLFSHPVMSDSLRPHGLQHTRPPCPSPSLGSLPKFMFIASVMPSNHLILWCPLLLLPLFFPSIRDFSNESYVPIRWPRYWSFSFSISPASE